MLSGIAGALIGILIGGTGVWLWINSWSDGPEEVAKLKRENARFREEVNEHFVQTAELINRLTDSYKAVFDHLSDGAEKLVDLAAVRERMPQVTDEEVRLKRLGAPVAATEGGAAEAEEAEIKAGEAAGLSEPDADDSAEPEAATEEDVKPGEAIETDKTSGEEAVSSSDSDSSEQEAEAAEETATKTESERVERSR